MPKQNIEFGGGMVNDQVVQKAGAFVLTNKRMAFMMGPTVDQTALAIVRLGGHREGAETAWECAQREVFEESQLQITPLTPSMTFYCPNTRFDIEIELEPITKFQNTRIEPCPLIVGHQNSLTLKPFGHLLMLSIILEQYF